MCFHHVKKQFDQTNKKNNNEKKHNKQKQKKQKKIKFDQICFFFGFLFFWLKK